MLRLSVLKNKHEPLHVQTGTFHLGKVKKGLRAICFTLERLLQSSVMVQNQRAEQDLLSTEVHLQTDLK